VRGLPPHHSRPHQFFLNSLDILVMSNSSSGGGMGHVVKQIAVDTLKILAIIASFIFKVIGAICSSLAALLEKLSGHGSGH